MSAEQQLVQLGLTLPPAPSPAGVYKPCYADGKYLYVADPGGRKTYRYTINADGSLEDRQLFAEQGSDGMAIDNKGNIYLTGNGVTIFNAEGKKIEHIAIPAKWTANVCFGGKHKNILFITASESVYTVQMQVSGAE